jgi:protein gp37
MAATSKIEWTDATWNPWHGCHKVSPGCKNCYMFRAKRQYGQDPDVVVRSKTKFYDPLKWPDSRLIFTCSWSDFFIEEADEWRDEAFAIMALTPHHTYQVLTKRPERMKEYMTHPDRFDDVESAMWAQISDPTKRPDLESIGWPLPNVWLGVSVEDQKTADERIPVLLETPAVTRWLSVEPLLGPIDLQRIGDDGVEFIQSLSMMGWTELVAHQAETGHDDCESSSIDWVVVGGESGHTSRPMHPEWVRSLRDQCVSAQVPFFFKQWGEWEPLMLATEPGASGHTIQPGDRDWGDGYFSRKVGKRRAGRSFQGRTWNDMPEVTR